MKREYIITFFSLLLAAYVGFVIYQKHYHPDQFHRRYINNLSEYKASASEVVANADSILTVYSRSENRLVRAEFRILGKQETYSYGDQYAVFIESFDKNTFKNTEKLWNKKLSSDHVRITKNKTLKYQLKKYPTNAQSYDDGQIIYHSLYYASENLIDEFIQEKDFIKYKRLDKNWLYSISETFIP